MIPYQKNVTFDRTAPTPRPTATATTAYVAVLWWGFNCLLVKLGDLIN